jgi:hypothetical protein
MGYLWVKGLWIRSNGISEGDDNRRGEFVKA